MTFDTETAAFKAEYIYTERAANTDTVIYLNKEYWYVNDPSVTISVNDTAVDLVGTFDNNHYTFDVSKTTSLTVKEGDKITITATKA